MIRRALVLLLALAGLAEAGTILKAGTTSFSDLVFIQDSSKTTGVGLAGLTAKTASLTCYYAQITSDRSKIASTVMALADIKLTDAWTKGGFIEVDKTNMVGWYRIDIFNEALATAATTSCGVHLQGAANMAPVVLKYDLIAVDMQTALSAQTIKTVTDQLTAAAIATGVWQDKTAGDLNVADSIGESLYVK